MSKEAQVDKKEIGALLEELDGLAKEATPGPLRVMTGTPLGKVSAIWDENLDPVANVYGYRGGQEVPARARANAQRFVAHLNAYPELRAYIHKAEKVIAAAALADLDEGDTDGD